MPVPFPPQDRATDVDSTPTNPPPELLALLGALGDGVVYCDADGIVRRQNAAMTAIAGRELAGLALDRALAPLALSTTEGTPLGADDFPEARARRGDRVVDEGFMLGHGRGATRVLRITSLPVASDGRPFGTVSVWRDITALKRTEEALRASDQKLLQDIAERRRAADALRESERLYRAIGESLDYGVWVCEPDGRNIYASESFLSLVGITQQQCSDFGWGDVLHPDDSEQTIAAWKECVRTGGRWSREHRYRGVDGEWHPILARGVPVKDEQGNVLRWAGINLDISEQKRAEHALREADQRKNAFLAVLSHELRNPLAPIRNAIHLLRHAEPGSTRAANALAVIDRQATQLARLVDDLLDVTRISSNKIHLERTRLELGEIVRNTIEDYRSLFERAQVRLTVSHPPEPILVDADRSRLAQVVGNLLQNAAKFTGAGGATHVTVEDDAGAAVVRVADTGVGLARDMLARLFHPFSQADETLDRAKGGLGLGLALVKGLVELHGGTVSAQSEGVGRGAQFVVRIPRASAEAGRSAGAAEAEGNARRILVIEDNADAADTLRDVLELEGHVVEVANAGAEGLQKARAFRPDTVICDIGLPGMDGYQVARALRADPELAPTYLVALSGYANPEDLERARQAGFDRHVRKPPSIDGLREVLAGRPGKAAR